MARAVKDRWGSRCRDTYSGRWIPCDVCGTCAIKNSRAKARRKRRRR